MTTFPYRLTRKKPAQQQQELFQTRPKIRRSRHTHAGCWWDSAADKSEKDESFFARLEYISSEGMRNSSSAFCVVF